MYVCMYVFVYECICIDHPAFNASCFCRGHAMAVRLLLAMGIDVYTADNRGITALHLAADSGHIDILQALIENGSEINSQVSV